MNEELKDLVIKYQEEVLPSLMDTVGRARAKNKARYEELFPTMIAWLNRNGIISPANHKEFYTYFLIKYNHVDDFDLLPEPTRLDIYEFGKWQEKWIKFKYSFKLDKNNFSGMPISEVEEYFLRELGSSQGNKGIPYLSDEDIACFLKNAFYEVSPTKSKLTLKTPSVGKAREIFHKFYTNSCMYEETNNCTDKYIKLLTDHFKGFTFEKTKKNFRTRPLNAFNSL